MGTTNWKCPTSVPVLHAFWDCVLPLWLLLLLCHRTRYIPSAKRTQKCMVCGEWKSTQFSGVCCVPFVEQASLHVQKTTLQGSSMNFPWSCICSTSVVSLEVYRRNTFLSWWKLFNILSGNMCAGWTYFFKVKPDFAQIYPQNTRGCMELGLAQYLPLIYHVSNVKTWSLRVCKHGRRGTNVSFIVCVRALSWLIGGVHVASLAQFTAVGAVFLPTVAHSIVLELKMKELTLLDFFQSHWA